MKRNTGYYCVTIFGLAVSLASFILILSYVKDEISYDRFHASYDKIFRVTVHLKLNDVFYNEAPLQFPAAAALKADLPEINEAVRIFPRPITLELNDKKIDEPRTIFADSNFFNVFTFPVITGDKNTMLREANSIVLTRKAATRYFGKEDPVGKQLILGKQNVVVTGMIDDVPEQSHLKFEILLPLELQLNQWKNQFGLEGRENKWFWNGAYTYILLKERDDEEKVSGKLPAFVEKYFPQRYKDGGGRLGLQPLTDIHLKSNLNGEFEPGGSELYIQLFALVGFVIVLVSSINLVNLSHFNVMKRVKEIGIRKFLGQMPRGISSQLLLESAAVGIISFVLSVAIAWVFMNPFNLMVGKNIDLFSPNNIFVLGSSLCIAIVISVIAVFKPAIQYAKESAQKLLLIKLKQSKISTGARNVLVGFQIGLSFILLVFTLAIFNQLQLFKTKSLGFDKDFVVAATITPDVAGKFKALKTEWRKNANVIGVTGVEQPPGTGYSGYRFVPEGGSYEKPLMLPFTVCDEDFVEVMGITIKSGRNFDPTSKIDSLPPLLINEQAVIDLGWSNDDALGRTLEVFQPGTSNIMMKGIVIGIMSDFHSESLHRPIKPLVVGLDTFFGSALIKISGTNPQEAVQALNDVWKTLSEKPFTYEFLDKQLEQLYSNEIKLGNIIMFFTLVGLYLTCHGLFAMSSLLFASKLKDVSVRKVFGASRTNIIKQLYSRYFLFKLASIVLAVPLAYGLLDRWLQSFQYRIELTPGLFLESAGIIMLVGMASVVYYLMKVAVSNPIKFLRSE